MRSSRLSFVLAVGLAVGLLLMPSESRGQSVVAFVGQVFNAKSCRGVGQLLIKLTPPSGSKDYAVHVTDTDKQGVFHVTLPDAGKYYLEIFDGATPIYGNVVRIPDQNPLSVALDPKQSTEPTTEADECDTPVSLALSSDGNLFALDAAGRVLTYSVSHPHVPAREVAVFDPHWQVADMTIGHSDNQTYLLVSMWNGNYGQVLRYSTAGHFEGNWFLHSAAGGLASDDSSGRALFSVPGTGQLYSPGYSSPTLGKPFFVFPWGEKVLPLAVDGPEKVLYAGAVSHALVYSLNLRTRTPGATIPVGVGAPAALAVDARRRRLLVADGPGGKIWLVHLGPHEGNPTVFVQGRPLKQPSALAVGADGNVWVGDQAAHAIFEYSSNGHLLNVMH